MSSRRGHILVVSRLAMMLVPLLLLFLVLPRLVSGVKYEAAYPAPNYIAINVGLPESSYLAAHAVLSTAPHVDGGAHILAAEAGLRGGLAFNALEEDLRTALARSPASVRGWMVLAQYQALHNPNESVKAFGLVHSLAPHDYWMTASVANTGAALWGFLPTELRDYAGRRAVDLWHDSGLRRRHLRPLLGTPNGPALMTFALATTPEEIRELNRWIRKVRRSEYHAAQRAQRRKLRQTR